MSTGFLCGSVIALCLALGPTTAMALDAVRSHPALRTVPSPPDRPADKGPTRYVDAVKGDDRQDGSQIKPWKTINFGLSQLSAGDTLYLRAGVYYENVSLRLTGRSDAPITIRSFPKELAILDGSLREFFDEPADSWEPYAQGAPGEFRSTVARKNVRNVVGSFGDSMVGLQTYFHASDLRAEGEIVVPKPDQSDVLPVYCGPGVWYDAETGHLHARLAHTQLADHENYRGETDPRKLPLVIAPVRSVPLHVDGARHVRIRDLVIRGGGYDTVLLDQASDIEFDNVTIWAGTFGLRARGTQKLRLFRSGFYGNAPPWHTRHEASFNSYPGRATRDISRLNTHAWLVADGPAAADVNTFPFNDDWEIAWCEFGDSGADGLYFGGVNTRFHHNLVDNTTDDGLYLSPMYPRPVRFMGPAKLYLYQNYFSRALTMFAFGGAETVNTDTIYFHRNLVDLRAPVRHNRPTEKGGKVAPFAGRLMGDHGGPPWPSFFAYHNTFIAAGTAASSDMWLLRGATQERPRQMFNNILVHGGDWLPHVPGTEFAHADGNLYWHPGLAAEVAAGFFGPYRSTPAFADSKKFHAPGFDSQSLVADPKFVKAQTDWKVPNDYRLQDASPAVDAGAELPADWPDPLRKLDKGRPDIGALPLGSEPFRFGRAAASIEP